MTCCQTIGQMDSSKTGRKEAETQTVGQMDSSKAGRKETLKTKGIHLAERSVSFLMSCRSFC